MVLTVHHLGQSQSERIVWLCEELGIEYKLVKHTRDASRGYQTPDELKQVPGNALEAAPIIQDGDVTLPQSGAIVEYLLLKYDPEGKLSLKPDDPDWVSYIYWFHVANGDLQPAVFSETLFTFAKVPEDNMFRGLVKMRFERMLRHLNDRLSKAEYLAGNKFTAADIMCMFSVTTHRIFHPFSLEAYPNIVRWLQLCGSREAYKSAMAKGDPDLPSTLDSKPPTGGPSL